MELSRPRQRFEERMANAEKARDRTMKVAIGLWFVTAVASVAFTAAVIYVAVHFIAKLW